MGTEDKKQQKLLTTGDEFDDWVLAVRQKRGKIDTPLQEGVENGGRAQADSDVP